MKFRNMTNASEELSPAELPRPGEQGAVYLVDISGYVFRAFYALPPLTSSKGEPTGAIYGVTSMLLKLVRERQPHMLAVVMDSPGKSFRHEAYDQYKATRPAHPPDLAKQMGHVREVADAYAIPCYAQPGVEADDLIATLTKAARARGHRVVIVSADKDLLQLVGDGVWMLDTMRDKAFGPLETHEKMGVRPDQVRDFLALTGDSSDNIPGVPSVGPKTAVELLREHQTLEGIYERVEDIKKKALKQKLIDHRDLAFISQRLVSLKDDLSIEFDEKALAYGGWNDRTLRSFYTEFGFTRLIDLLDATGAPTNKMPSAKGAAKAPVVKANAQTSLFSDQASTPAAASEPTPAEALEISLPSSAVADTQQAPSVLPPRIEARTELITDAQLLPEVLATLRKAQPIALFCAVENEEPVAGALIGLALANSEGHGFYLPTGHAYLGCPDQLAVSDVVNTLGPLLADPSVAKVSSNVKRDVIALSRIGVTLAGTPFDTMMASYLLDPDLRGHGVAEIILRRENRILHTYESACGKGKSARPLGELRFEEVIAYAHDNTAEVLHAALALEQELEEAKLARLLSELETKLSYVLADMEQAGIRCDPDKLRVLSLQVDKELATLEKKCFELAGQEFNVSSPRQLETILFDQLALPVVERTKTARSTNHDVLEELAILHPLPAAILEHRSLAKLKGTYLDALPREINPRTGRIHTRFDQAVAATGRLSSNDPNLQNIPIRTEVGRAIRDAFVAREGCLIFAADYSQIELRVLAHLSRDEALLEAFGEAADVHARTAQALFNVEPEGVTRAMRAAAKTVNFAVIYGQTQFALARNLRISRGEAQQHIKSFFARYHGVRRYLDALVQEARETGYVRTIMGRRRVISDIRAKNHAVRSGAERIAQNTPIQGSAADILKTAMVRTAQALKEHRLEARMLLTVHDELVFEANESEREKLEHVVREAMEGAVKLDVPLVVGAGWGPSWGAAH
jgi:DNA polymerase-1